jgi:WD40 repeat protein
MATAGNEGIVHLWDVSQPAQGRLLAQLVGHTREINDLLYTPDGAALISGAADQSLRVWDLATGQCLQTIEEETGHCKTLALDPTRRLVAAAGWAGIVRIFHLNERNHLESVHTFKAHATRIAQIAFHPEGRHLISVSQSGTVRMWDVDTGQPLMRWHGHTQQGQAAGFHPQGQLLATGGEDETVRLWRYDLERVRAGAGQAEPPEGECAMVLRAPGPYEKMNIAGVTGIGEAQRSALMMLGAVE